MHDSKDHLSDSIAALTTALAKKDERQHDPPVGDSSHENNMQSVSHVADRILEAGQACYYHKVDQLLLDSLCFGQMEDRFDAIPDAFTGTFQWVLEAQPAETVPWADLPTWLKTESLGRLFWVTGKPGSGKSTLMRHIVRQECTTLQLSLWAMPRRLIMASCFFWHSGDIILRSEEGLLRTLLFQILSQAPQILREVCPWRWRAHATGSLQLSVWTLPQLHKAFTSALKMLANSAKICLFIDGLDEFEGSDNEHHNLTTMIKRFSEFEHVKICFSSRPWVIFQAAFEELPKLEMHLLTCSDIHEYIDQQLLNTSEFEGCRKRTTESIGTGLRDESSTKAEGVFLWVVLVIKDLLNCMRNRDGIEDIWRKVQSTPADLHKHFKAMFDRLDDFYLHQACLAFRVAITSKASHTLITYSYVLEDSTFNAIDMEVREMSGAEFQSRGEECEWKLNSRCRGLFEVSPVPNNNPDPDRVLKKVDFIHRTVKDFLLAGGLSEIEQRVPSSFKRDINLDVDEVLAKCFLAQIKTIDANGIDHFGWWGVMCPLIARYDDLPWGLFDQTSLRGLINMLCSAAESYETKHGSALTQVIDALDQTMATWHRKSNSNAVRGLWTASFGQVALYLDLLNLSTYDAMNDRYSDMTIHFFALDARLFEYFRVKFERDRRLISLASQQSLFGFLLRGYAFVGPAAAIPVEINTTVLELLLVNGADPNKGREGMQSIGDGVVSVWSLYLENLEGLLTVVNRTKHLRVVQLMVIYGAEPWPRCSAKTYSQLLERANNSMSIKPHRNLAIKIGESYCINSLEIIEACFGEDVVSELPDNFKDKRRDLPKI